MVPALSGLLGLVALIAFISALPASYKVEARSRAADAPKGLPRFTNVWGVALGVNVARDPETRALQAQVRRRLGLALGALVVMFVLVMAFAPR